LALNPVHKSEEDALVGAARAGDPNAFGALVDAYGRAVFNLALRMVGNREDARDLAQTVFVKAYQKLETFDGRARFFSWMYRIAINESLNWLSRRKSVVELDERLESGDPTPDVRAEASEEERMVQDALMDLTAEYRQVIVLRHFMDLSHTEMGGILHLPEKTVKSRLHTARARLGEALRKRGYGPR
jgi:RNA polymerase sigma-70 factor, ECF subfamily